MKRYIVFGIWYLVYGIGLAGPALAKTDPGQTNIPNPYCPPDAQDTGADNTVIGGFIDVLTPDFENLTKEQSQQSVTIYWNCQGPPIQVPIIGYCLPKNIGIGTYNVGGVDAKGNHFVFEESVSADDPNDASSCTPKNIAQNIQDVTADNTPVKSSFKTKAASKASSANLTPTGNTPEEQAVYNIDTSQLPVLVDQDKLTRQDNPNIFDGIPTLFRQLTNFFTSTVGTIFRPSHPDQLVGQSSKSTQVIVPDQIKTEVDQKSADDRAKSYFGRSTGIYGAQMPEMSSQKDTVGDYEKTYEQANFPDGIHPITGQ